MTRLRKYIRPIQEAMDAKMREDWERRLVFRIRKDCKPWLTAIKGCRYKTLWRGINDTAPSITNNRVRVDRISTDMNIDLQEKWDKAFYTKFGWKPRTAGLFVTGNLGVSMGYGQTSYMVFPVGRFKYIWSPGIPDLYAYGHPESHYSGNIDTDNPHKVVVEKMFKSTGLCEAIDSDHEIMIRCDKYHAVSYKMFLQTGAIEKFMERILGKNK